MKADAIVNTANPRVLIGPGVDKAIHKKAGKQLLKARRNIGDIPVGNASITDAYNLDAKYVIHTVGPRWRGGNFGEAEAVRSCYMNSLELAKKYDCTSIAFPLISTGNYGFPKEHALKIAMDAIKTFLEENEMMIYLVVFDAKSYQLSEELAGSVESYIDENYVETIQASRIYDATDFDRCARVTESAPVMYSAPVPPEDAEPAEPVEEQSASAPKIDFAEMMTVPRHLRQRKLEDLIRQLDESFSQRLIRLIDEKERKDSDVYKKANISRQHFSKIRNNKDYQPTKATALAFALALELNLDETKDLLTKAGYALSHSSLFDVIVEFFIVNGQYDLYEINQVLFKYEQPLIGG